MKLCLNGLWVWLAAVQIASAWDYDGHRIINQLALAALPTNFPAFVRTPGAQERVAFLAGEPDRWRNVSDLALRHCNGPDHYIDLEELEEYSLAPGMLPLLRYDFVAELARVRAAHPEKFVPIDPAKNTDHTRELVGLLPWTINEYYARLKSGFSYLRTFEQFGGTPEEIANAQANILYVMGTMGHFVGDSAQPLHATKHHHGWVGDNPERYSTERSFHGWIDGGFVRKIGGTKVDELAGQIRPAQRLSADNQLEGVFRAAVTNIVAAGMLVEPLYVLEKEGKLTGEEGKGREGRTFLEGQLVKGGQLLGDIWFSAWQDATEDKYLRAELEKRRAAKAALEQK